MSGGLHGNHPAIPRLHLLSSCPAAVLVTFLLGGHVYRARLIFVFFLGGGLGGEIEIITNSGNFFLILCDVLVLTPFHYDERCFTTRQSPRFGGAVFITGRNVCDVAINRGFVLALKGDKVILGF